jgi:subfamily B ATP-binding cassette protein MsbA
MRILQKNISNLIKGDSAKLKLLFALAGCGAIFTGAEMASLFLIGNALVGSDMLTLTTNITFINFIESYSQTQLLVILGAVFALVTGLRFVFQLGYHYYTFEWGAHVTIRLQTEIMETCLTAPISKFDTYKPGEIIHGLMEAPLGGNYVIDGISGLVANLFTIILVSVMLFFISPWVLVVGMSVSVLTFVIVVSPLQKKLRVLKNRLIVQRTRSTSMATNMISSIRDIKSLYSEYKMAGSFARSVDEGLTAFSRARFVKIIPGPTLQAVFQLAFAGAIMVMSSSVAQDEIANYLPQLAVIGYGLMRIYPAITNISRSWLEIQNAIPDLLVCEKWLTTPYDDLSNGSYSIPASYNFQGIQFQNVSFNYEQEKSAISDLSFKIEPGKITSIVGGSGAGKSTLIDLILKFRATESGTVWLGDKNLRDVVRKSWLKKIGVVRQEIFLFNGTIKDNLLAWEPKASEKDMLSACAQAGVLDFVNSLPDRLETKVGDRGVTMSGGQRQRIAIARALLRNPQILILDEALSALDGETEAQVLQSLQENYSDRTIIMVSHRMTSIVKSDSIIVLEQGSIVEQGTHKELLARKGRYYELFATQRVAL